MVLIAKQVEKIPGIKGSALLQFLAPLTDNPEKNTDILRTTDWFNLERHSKESLHTFVNLHRVNDIHGINRFFKKVNEKLIDGGSFAGCTETLEQRRERLFRKYPIVFSYIYYLLDFIFKRVFPKFHLTKKFYLFVTNGRNRALSKSEVLGRLVYCGFSIDEVEEINNLLYFKARKVSTPLSEPEPSTGILLKVKRVGRNGNYISVYKFRTMHPYAQYLQAYVFEQFNLMEGGKFRNDFRITKWGRWMRRFWVDELPMIYNVLRGDIKLVGVRPLSEHYLSLYTPEHKSLRVQGKPGLIPPFYADMPVGLDEIMASEQRYILAYGQEPFTTDLHYCMKAIGNIFLKKARSH